MKIYSTDDELVLSIQKGHDEAFKILYKKYEGKLMGYLYFRLKNTEIAEEVFQITWTKVLDHIYSYKESNSFSSWLFTIAANTVKDWFKKTHNQNRLLESFKSSQSIDLNESRTESLDLSFLKTEYQRVIELQYIEGLSSKEISKELNLSESNVRKIASRAKKQIKEHVLSGGQLS